MDNNYMKQFSVVMLGLLLMGMTNVFGQNVSDTPTNHNLTLDNNKLYEHGYNSSNETGTTPAADEATDMVTVGSTMPYFVMPDKTYNPDYYNQTNYKATNLTKSKFDWTLSIPANGVITPQAANTTNTSPWVKIKWNVTGSVDVAVVESQDASCAGDATKINVQVIQKPEIMFDMVSGTRTLTECVPSLTTGYVPRVFDLVPVNGTVITQSTDVKVTYDITYVPLAGVSTTATFTNTGVSLDITGNTLALGSSVLKDYGTYTIVIKTVSDKISRKSIFEGGELPHTLGTVAQETFVYTMLPKPQAGKVYHIPNN